MQMPSGLSARVVAVFTLLLGVSIAQAERRPVAVIDLSNEKVTVDLAAELNPVLWSHPELQPIRDSKLAGELYGEFVNEEDRFSRDAEELQRSAEDDLAGFSLRVAEEKAGDGQTSLLHVQPNSVMLRNYAQLAFLRGQAMLGDPKKAAGAAEQFAITRRLDPAFAPDPGRYLPDIVQAFNDAMKKWIGKATLVVVGHGRLWIDGREAGSAPAEVEVEAGPHVVWLTGTERMTTGATVVLQPATKKTLEIPDAPADTRVKLQRARKELRKGDPTARAAAMKQIAKLVGTKDALLLTAGSNKVVIYQWWNDGTLDKPGFSAFHEVGKKKPIELLTGLAPPKPNVAKQNEEPLPPVVEKRWYERRSVQASIAIGVVAAIVGGYYLYKNATSDTVDWDPDIGMAGRVRW
jgi:hypothetical protein